MGFKRSVKYHAAALFHETGVLKRLCRAAAANGALVLAYHRVLPSPADEKHYVQPGMYVSVDSFEKHLDCLRSRFNVIPLVELRRRLSDGEDISGCCCLTFDDGWLDNYRYAFAVLEKYQLPATVFLATGFVGSERLFWPDELAFFLAGMTVEELVRKTPELAEPLKRSGHRPHRPVPLDEVIELLKTWPQDDRERFLAALRRDGGAACPERLLMSWDEARSMQASGLVDFGSHTQNHVLLDQASAPEVKRELEQSRRDIHDQLGVETDLFAYPNGNYTPAHLSALTRAGYRAAVTTRKGWVSRRDNPYEISRICMHEDVSHTIPLFLSRLHFRGF